MRDVLDAKAGETDIKERVAHMTDKTGLVDEERFLAVLHSEAPGLADHWDCGFGSVAIRIGSTAA